MQFIAMIVMVMGLNIGMLVQDCPAIQIVQNGLNAFAAGEPQIGPYTDAGSYLLGGLDYIELACGVRVGPEVFDREN